MAVTIEYEPEFRPLAPIELFANNFVAVNILLQVYDVASDGRFLMTQRTSNEAGGTSARVIIVQNWLDELARAVPTD